MIGSLSRQPFLRCLTCSFAFNLNITSEHDIIGDAYDVRGANFGLHRAAARWPRWTLNHSISQTGGCVRCQSRPELSAESDAYCAAALNWASVQQCGRSFLR